MIRSMTGFSRKHKLFSQIQLVWELRSINHRYLELSIRTPENLRSLEPKIHELLKKRLRRGKVECTLKITDVSFEDGDIQLNQELLENLVQHCEELNQKLSNPAPLSAIELLKWPGATGAIDMEENTLNEEVLALLENGLDDLSASREREGQSLNKLLTERNLEIQKHVAQVQKRLPELTTAYRDKLLARLDELDLETRNERIEQELVIVAQKLDISEELDRLDHHCKEVSRTLKKGGAVGRRLDFLMQELNREANTLASKSNSVDNTMTSVELKVLIEQMREQVQNIE